MIIPTFLALILNAILIFIAYLIITANGIDVIELAFGYVFKSLENYTQIIYILLALLGAEVIFLIIQAFILKLITFDIIKCIKKLYCKIRKKEFVENLLKDLTLLAKYEDKFRQSVILGVCDTIKFKLKDFVGESDDSTTDN